MGFLETRPVQRDTLPAALAGRDVLGLAQTGTGKTAAFALPILERMLARRAAAKGSGRRLTGPAALVIAPTRELALQIQAEFQSLGRFTPLRVAAVFGGVSQGAQVRALDAQPDVLVACPGRLLDLMQQRLCSLAAVETLVLDEADHLFDMGFLPSIRRILAKLPSKRQNLLFSATMPREIRSLANEVLRNPHVVELAVARPAETIEHRLQLVREGDKQAALDAVLRSPDFTRGIVFLRTKHRAKRLAMRLVADGYRAVALQGNLSQSQRERAMGGFREGRFDVLVATDIAARGIDVALVSHVVNFDLPTTPEAYTHRIGRTGRAEHSGRALTFATPDEAASVRAIERHLGAPIERIAAHAGGSASGSAPGKPAKSGGSARTESKGQQKHERRGADRAREAEQLLERTPRRPQKPSRAPKSRRPAKGDAPKPTAGNRPSRSGSQGFGAGL